MKNSKKKKGFTLVEVLVVVLIVGILAAIAIPSYHFTIERSRATQGITSLTQIAKAQKTYNAKRGKYAESMIGLPLDMKDSDGSEATGAEFADQYFDYKIFGDEFERARATRNTGEYELSVDYGTGQIFCRPIEHKICQDLNLAEGYELITWPQQTGCDPAEYGYSSSYYNCYRVLYKDGTKMDTICRIENPMCYVYNNDGNLTQRFFTNPSVATIYDPDTGKKIAQLDYNADGSFQRYTEFEDGIPTRGIDKVGNVTRLIDYDEGSGSDYYLIRNNQITRWENYSQQKYEQYYDSEGRLSRVYFYAISGVKAQVNYNTNGEISSFVCMSGNCENWTPPEMSSFKYQIFPEIPEMNNNCLEDHPDNPMVCGAS